MIGPSVGFFVDAVKTVNLEIFTKSYKSMIFSIKEQSEEFIISYLKLQLKYGDHSVEIVQVSESPGNQSNDILAFTVHLNKEPSVVKK